jgi:hypothetical protein
MEVGNQKAYTNENGLPSLTFKTIIINRGETFSSSQCVKKLGKNKSSPNYIIKNRLNADVSTIEKRLILKNCSTCSIPTESVVIIKHGKYRCTSCISDANGCGALALGILFPISTLAKFLSNNDIW